MPRAGFGQAGQGLFLDPGDELVGLEVVGEGPGEGGLFVEDGALLHELGSADQGFLGRLDVVAQRGDLGLGGCRFLLPLGSQGLDDVGLVSSDLGREELAPAVSGRQLAQGVPSLLQGLVGFDALPFELRDPGLPDVALGGGAGDFGVEPGALLLDLLLLRFGLGPGFPGGVEGLELLLDAPDEGGCVVFRGLEASHSQGGSCVGGERPRLALLRLGLL